MVSIVLTKEYENVVSPQHDMAAMVPLGNLHFHNNTKLNVFHQAQDKLFMKVHKLLSMRIFNKKTKILITSMSQNEILCITHKAIPLTIHWQVNINHFQM